MTTKDLPLFVELARQLKRYHRVRKANNLDLAARVNSEIDSLAFNCLPSGSGLDNGCTLDLERSDGKSRVVINTSFHHMDDHGYYCGWTDHRVIVKADLAFDFELQITGRNYRDIKDMLADYFDSLLREPVRQVKRDDGTWRYGFSRDVDRADPVGSDAQ